MIKSMSTNPFFEDLSKTNNSHNLTPIKAIKEKNSVLVHMKKAYNDLLSKAVSTVRQPIESLFNPTCSPPVST